MRPLRTRVDRIDLSILRLLQQRTKLSRRIGELKRRHRALVYVPEREHEVLLRIARWSRGKFSPRAARAIFREILSSSRARQGQPPLGLLRDRAGAILPAARACFGACDRFEPRPGWPALARGLEDDSLALALLAEADLAQVLRTPAARRDFQERFAVAGDFPAASPSGKRDSGRVLIVMPRPGGLGPAGDRLVILIECKSTPDTVKRWLKSMPGPSLDVEQVTLLPASAALLRVKAGRVQKLGRVQTRLQSSATPCALLGLYHATEDDAE